MKLRNKKKKIYLIVGMGYKCSLCGREYEYRVRQKDNQCWHDNEFEPIKYELDSIKNARIKYAKDIIQPYKSDGSINKDFKKLYPKSEFLTKFLTKISNNYARDKK